MDHASATGRRQGPQRIRAGSITRSTGRGIMLRPSPERNQTMTKKIKLNKTQRAVIEEYGVKHIQSTIDRKQEAELYQAIPDGANKAIRTTYPAHHMVILRNFKLARENRCLRSQF